MKVVSPEAIPVGALGAFINMLLMLVTIWIGNASDYLRDKLRRDKNMRCWGLLQLLTDIPDATLGVLVGMAAGLVLAQVWGLRVHFSDTLFFYGVLPPIIFYQGYSLKKRRFFKHFHVIGTLGVLGTLLHFGVLVVTFILLNRLWLLLALPINSNLQSTGLLRDEVLLLCSVLSSADEVAALALIKQDQYPKLSAVLFGEGVLNDAVSILLFRSILSGAISGRTGALTSGVALLGMACYLLACSTVVGLVVSLAISRFLKVNTGLLQHPTRQTIIIIMGSYVSYVASEMFEVPGVLSVFVCGIIFSHFAWHSLAPEAQIGTAIFSHALSSAAEVYSFTALGLSVYRFQTRDWSLRYTCISLIGLLIARGSVVFGTFGLTGLLAPRHFAMSGADQWVLFGAGLIRGAITWAQALQMQGKNRRVMISTTLIVISATLVVVGGLLPSVLRALGLLENPTQDEGEMVGVEEALCSSVRRQESLLTADERAERADRALSASLDICELGPGALSRQPSSHVLAREAEQQEATPLLQPASIPVLPVPQQEEEPPRPPSLRGAGAPNATWAAAGANGGGMMSYQGPMLYGPVHRVWVHLDERFLKPVFGGRSRVATPWTCVIGGRAGGITPHGSYSESESQKARNANGYGAAGAAGQQQQNGGASKNGNAAGHLDPEALKRAFEQRGFHITSSSFEKAAGGRAGNK